MNIKGIATLQYLYPDGRLEPVGPPMSNDITWANFRHFFIHTGEMSLPTKRDAASLLNSNSAKWRIFYGANDSKQSPLGGWYWADGTVDVQQDFPTYTDGALVTDPDRFRLSAVIQAPIGAPRTIRCLGVNIISNGAVSAVIDFTSAHLTLLRLSTPCIQATNVAIVVTYDIYLYPALAISDHKLNSQLYTYLKTLLKRAANAVNSTNIQYGTYASRIQTSGNDSLLVSDQLIPASTAFDFRFKWHNVNVTSEGTLPEIGLATGNGTYTSSIRFRLNRANGTLGIYNNTTLLATIPSPSIEHECRIVRDGSNNIISYYNGVQQHAPVLITSRFVILANSDAGLTGAGWWDMKLTYTENRRVVRIGDLGTSTGSFNAKFSGLTTTPAAQDTRVLIGSGSPLTASLDYTASGVDLVATGQVKVATGAGWLIFHNNEPANPIDITTVCHFILNTQ